MKHQKYRTSNLIYFFKEDLFKLAAVPISEWVNRPRITENHQRVVSLKKTASFGEALFNEG